MTGCRLGYLAVLLLALAALNEVSSAAWTTSDSLPSLYNAVAAYCDPAKIQSWNCGFCSHNSGVHFVGFLEYKATSVFGYVSIFNNEGMKLEITARLFDCLFHFVPFVIGGLLTLFRPFSLSIRYTLLCSIFFRFDHSGCCLPRVRRA